jgi:hypothetical protein
LGLILRSGPISAKLRPHLEPFRYCRSWHFFTRLQLVDESATGGMMLSRRLKAAYYVLMKYPMRLNGQLYKAVRAPSQTHGKPVLVHLGPGQKNYLEGWYNLDSNFISARSDVWANLEDPLPFRDGTVDIFYSHHVVEHLEDRLIVGHFKEMFRALKPGGAIRVCGPNGDCDPEIP